MGSSVSPERLEQLRKLCLSLPEATEKETWGDPTWRVRDRIFAMQKGNHADGRASVWMKARPGEQAERVEADPATYFAPPYVGPKGWLGVYLDGDTLDWDELAALVRQSYRLIAPKRLAATLDVGGAFDVAAEA